MLYEELLEKIRNNNETGYHAEYNTPLPVEIRLDAFEVDKPIIPHTNPLNRIRVLYTLKRFRCLTRKQLCIRLDLAWTTIYDNLRKLWEYGFIKYFALKSGGLGRPTIYWLITQKGSMEEIV